MSAQTIAIEHDDQPCPRCSDTARQSHSCAQTVTIDQLRALEAFRRGAPDTDQGEDR